MDQDEDVITAENSAAAEHGASAECGAAAENSAAAGGGVVTGYGTATGRPASGSSASPDPLPAARPDQDGPFGIDLGVNMETIDRHLGRADVTYRDVRMVHDPADFSAAGGESELTSLLEGFSVAPYPYLGSIRDLPVPGVYDGPRLFDLAWDDAGRITGATPRYQESLAILEDVFPRDGAVFISCGAGAYAGMARDLLVFLGWDPSKVYNVGGVWGYEGSRSVDLMYGPEDDRRVAAWRVQSLTPEFDRLHPIAG